MTRPGILIGLGAFALGLIGWGAWWIYPPAAPLAVGLLLWISLERVK